MVHLWLLFNLHQIAGLPRKSSDPCQLDLESRKRAVRPQASGFKLEQLRDTTPRTSQTHDRCNTVDITSLSDQKPTKHLLSWITRFVFGPKLPTLLESELTRVTWHLATATSLTCLNTLETSVELNMARTKQTAGPKANGTPKPPPSPPPSKTPPALKSPTQPTELSDADRSKIKLWLDKQEKPFTITTVPLSRKRKRNSGLQAQTDLFEERLSVQYEVKPRDKWECLRRYKKFTGLSGP